ncbi:ATPase [Alphaproteobacteria bacterium]|nr:ATPase [Alphaproteobacteria bacterium]
MKRFFESVSVAEHVDGYVVALDDRPILTPAKKKFVLPQKDLADKIASEWDAQGEEVNTFSMPIMRLAATAVDRVADSYEATVNEFSNYAGSDLLCYRAENPPPLVERQADVWDPILQWATTRYDVSFQITQGIMPVAQPEQTRERLASAAAGDVFMLTGLSHGAAVLGSAVLSLALWEDYIDETQAYEASVLDNLFQIELWGEDSEQTHALSEVYKEIQSLKNYFNSLKL